MKLGILIITVVEIIGNCPVYKIGDSFQIIDGFKLRFQKNLCMHSISSIMPYYIALSRGIDPKELGLSKQEDRAYIQCLTLVNTQEGEQ